ncbi:hypothetical protein NAT51_05620 [Flavobacterium amniphilum]|uniref:DUF6929 family protein n=1 Tax=Flavobacterium amniphilum TaxID=1834035 RepID=UPI00202A0E6D|nr:hypothetical protein [Flavobacterium amniphilum]MCL9804986.1 hypothetical protein [Flavobacterium amniphilum]
MEKIQLIAFLTIQGIGAASGLVFHNNSLFIVSDNSGYLFEQKLDSPQLIKHSLVKDASVNIEKKRKPDFEAITIKNNKLHIFGSGSTTNRNRMMAFNLSTNQAIENDFSEIYQKLKNQAHISDDDLNIEGALYLNGNLHLFQRGNGLNAQNGIFIIDSNQNIQYHPIKLPKIKHVETSFTDAIVFENKIYFLAAAEDTVSTYEDGEVLGTIMGVMNSKTFEIEKTIQLSPTHKLEGLTLFEKQGDDLTFLLCEDNDTEDLNATIYKLKINFKKFQ